MASAIPSSRNISRTSGEGPGEKPLYRMSTYQDHTVLLLEVKNILSDLKNFLVSDSYYKTDELIWKN